MIPMITSLKLFAQNFDVGASALPVLVESYPVKKGFVNHTI